MIDTDLIKGPGAHCGSVGEPPTVAGIVFQKDPLTGHRVHIGTGVHWIVVLWIMVHWIVVRRRSLAALHGWYISHQFYSKKLMGDSYCGG